MSRISVTAFGVVLALAFLPAAARTATITTPSFEQPNRDNNQDPSDGDDGFDNKLPTGWSGSGGVWVGWDDADMDTPPDGDQWGLLFPRGDGVTVQMYQSIGTVQADTPYRMTVTIGSRDDLVGGLPGEFTYGLWSDPSTGSAPVNELATKNKADATDAGLHKDGNSVQMTVEFDSTGSPHVGENLFVRFDATDNPNKDGGEQISYDQVSLVIPEPASMMLLAPAGLLAIRRRRG